MLTNGVFFVLHKAKSLGVNFIFGVEGTFKEFVVDTDDQSVVKGVRTVNRSEYLADLVIVAGGGWTPTLVPELDGLCETTAGSVVSYQIPQCSPLWDRFAPENFPTYMIGIRAGAEGGVYGFPRDPNGVVKIEYRGTKYIFPYCNSIFPKTLTHTHLDTQTPRPNPTGASAVSPRHVTLPHPYLPFPLPPSASSKLSSQPTFQNSFPMICQSPGRVCAGTTTHSTTILSSIEFPLKGT